MKVEMSKTKMSKVEKPKTRVLKVGDTFYRVNVFNNILFKGRVLEVGTCDRLWIEVLEDNDWPGMVGACFWVNRKDCVKTESVYSNLLKEKGSK